MAPAPTRTPPMIRLMMVTTNPSVPGLTSNNNRTDPARRKDPSMIAALAAMTPIDYPLAPDGTDAVVESDLPASRATT